jgi:hypothetical protein
MRLASVRPSCSNALYPVRATRNKIKGLRESASWVGLQAPQPYRVVDLWKIWAFRLDVSVNAGAGGAQKILEQG